MSSGWSDADKSVAHEAAKRAKAAAENEALGLFQAYPVKKVEDLWNLELQIREWRRDRHHVFTLNFARAEDQIVGWLARGWIDSTDIDSFSESRLEKIRKKSGYKA